jgi:hypothetical protein
MRKVAKSKRRAERGASTRTATAGTNCTLTQAEAPSAKQSKSKPVAAQSGRLAACWLLGLASCRFSLLDPRSSILDSTFKKQKTKTKAAPNNNNHNQ